MKMIPTGRVVIVVVVALAVVIGLWSFMQGQKAAQEAAKRAAEVRRPRTPTTRTQPPAPTLSLPPGLEMKSFFPRSRIHRIVDHSAAARYFIVGERRCR